jgi:hypothetical protein
MTDSTQPEAAKVQAPVTGMRGETQQKWGCFGAEEIAALKDNDDLLAPGAGQTPTRQGQGSERRRRFRERSSALVARSSQDVVSGHRC